ncbi:MAG: lipoate--protein ligase [Clostridiaceae bacterium]
MIYIETGSSDVYFNFGLEYYFTAVKKLDEPVFLFWRTQPSLMIGKYQNTFEEINLEYAESHGINIVRRLSGGGTIYTDLGGWQFTFIDYNGGEEIEFKQFIAPVVDALRALGVPAEFTGRNDLVIEGKKFSGNAQYKLAGSTVHHGSTLFDTNIEEMVKSTNVDPEKIISKSIKSVRDRVTNISEHLLKPMTGIEFKEHMISFIMKESDKTYELTPEDRKAIREIADEKFRPWEVRFGANPKFSMTKTARLKGGRITFKLDAEKSVITGAQVNGDFFGNDKADKLAKVIIGVPLERTALLEQLNLQGMDNALYGITIEEIVDTILS